MKQCANGHIYDETKYAECPYCSGGVSVRPLAGNTSNFPQTAPLNPQAGAAGVASNAASGAAAGSASDLGAFPKTMPLNNAQPAPKPASGPASGPEPKPEPNKKKEMGVTVALNATDTGINPVKGWLVVVEGEKKGISFTIHGDRNTIGRGNEHDINISFDKASSKSGDAVISFDPRKSRFHITVLEGKNNVYLNDNILLQPEEIKDYDILEIGTTKFVFRSLCNEQFTY